VTRIQQVRTTRAPAISHGGYTTAVTCGELVFVSGQLPFDPDTGELVGDDARAQTRQVLDNLRNALEDAGSNLGSMVKVNVFIRKRSMWADMNDVYCEIVPAPRPPRTTLTVSELADGVFVEIDCVAVRNEGDSAR
jgi:2-iminobutanoate/2-iminopropanoate deaminase